MKIPSINNINYCNSGQKGKNVNFMATPQQMLKAIDGASGICPCKLKFVGKIAEIFQGVQDYMVKNLGPDNKFIYKLGKDNNLPDWLKTLEVKGANFAQVDDVLTKKSFTCASGNCSSGAKNQGQFISDLLSSLGVKESDTITLSS